MNLTIRPLVPTLWSPLEDLFDDSKVCSRCWCMYWRIGPAYRKRSPQTNRASLREVITQGPSPGLLAFDGMVAVGWCQVTPRAAAPWLDRAWRLKGVDDLPVWSVSCFYIRKSHRKRGITSALIAEALKTAKRAKAPPLEAYPLDRDVSPSATSTGVVSTFVRAGFETVAQTTKARPIMRHLLNNLPRR